MPSKKPCSRRSRTTKRCGAGCSSWRTSRRTSSREYLGPSALESVHCKLSKSHAWLGEGDHGHTLRVMCVCVCVCVCVCNRSVSVLPCPPPNTELPDPPPETHTHTHTHTLTSRRKACCEKQQISGFLFSTKNIPQDVYSLQTGNSFPRDSSCTKVHLEDRWNESTAELN